jgi:hypothetical protein
MFCALIVQHRPRGEDNICTRMVTLEACLRENSPAKSTRSWIETGCAVAICAATIKVKTVLLRLNGFYRGDQADEHGKAVRASDLW